jgi:hypothetical protein
MPRMAGVIHPDALQRFILDLGSRDGTCAANFIADLPDMMLTVRRLWKNYDFVCLYKETHIGGGWIGASVKNAPRLAVQRF